MFLSSREPPNSCCCSFDRILSIEMFEHMKNYEALLAKVSSWMRQSVQEGDGRAGAEARKDEDPSLLFIHIFCHRDTPYHFEEGDGWMAKNFFSGGTMPSHDLFVSCIPWYAFRPY